MNEWTSVRVARRFVRVLGMEESAKTRIHRVIRNFVAKDILRTEIDEDDGRGAMRFSDSEAAIALLLLPLADLAVDARGLRDVAEALRKPDNYNDAPIIPGVVRPITSQIERGIAAALEGTKVVLSIDLGWDLATSKISRNANLFIGSRKRDPEAETVLNDYERIAFANLASITVPATALFNAFFSGQAD